MLRKSRVRGLDGGECGSQREQNEVGRQEDNPTAEVLYRVI
jgi:hypothetical protein